MRFTKEEELQILDDYKNGMRLFELSEKYNRASCSIIGMLKKNNQFIPKNSRWSKEEISLLKSAYPNSNSEDLIRMFPGRTLEQLHAKASKLGISRDSCHWRSDDLEFLKRYYSDYTAEELFQIFDGRYTIKAIRTKGKKLGIANHTNFWTPLEDEILRKNYSCKMINEFSNLLPGRSYDAIVARARHLHLDSYFGRTNYFTDEQREFIRNNWKCKTDSELANILKKTACGIQAQRSCMGLLRCDKDYTGYVYLDKIFRGQLWNWKKESMERCGYSCVLSGSKDFSIHHLIGFNTILSKAYRKMDSAGLLKSKNIDDYEKDELDQMIKIFLEIHNTYPLGVCVRKDLHDLFHKIYGAGGNTEEQWDIFSENYKKGLYK